MHPTLPASLCGTLLQGRKDVVNQCLEFGCTHQVQLHCCTAHPFPQRNEFTLLVRRSTSLSFLPKQITLLSPLASQYFRSKTHCIVISKRLYSGYGSGGTAAHTDEKQCVWWLIFKQSRDFFIQLYKLLVIKEPLRNFQHPMPESGKQWHVITSVNDYYYCQPRHARHPGHQLLHVHWATTSFTRESDTYTDPLNVLLSI